MTTLTDTRAFLARVPAGLVEVRGDDRATFLNAVVSQEIEALPAGRWAGALLLDAHGSPLALMDVVVLDGRVLLVLDDDARAGEVADLLRGRTFLAQVTVEHVPDVTRWALRGASDQVMGLVAPRQLAAGEASETDAAVVIARHDGIDLIGTTAPSAVAAVLAAGVRAADADALHAWRVAHGQPQWGHEVRPPHLPEELGLLPTHVHLQKGCYPGQEAVARMWMLGRPRRRLARVALTGAAAPGWTYGEGKQRVEVTSAAEVDGERVGLAFVPADATPQQRFGDDGANVVVDGFVGDGEPIPGWDASVVRRRDRR